MIGVFLQFKDFIFANQIWGSLYGNEIGVQVQLGSCSYWCLFSPLILLVFKFSYVSSDTVKQRQRHRCSYLRRSSSQRLESTTTWTGEVAGVVDAAIPRKSLLRPSQGRRFYSPARSTTADHHLRLLSPRPRLHQNSHHDNLQARLKVLPPVITKTIGDVTHDRSAAPLRSVPNPPFLLWFCALCFDDSKGGDETWGKRTHFVTHFSIIVTKTIDKPNLHAVIMIVVHFVSCFAHLFFTKKKIILWLKIALAGRIALAVLNSICFGFGIESERERVKRYGCFGSHLPEKETNRGRSRVYACF